MAQFVHPNTPNQLVTAGVPRLVVTKSVQVFLAQGRNPQLNPSSGISKADQAVQLATATTHRNELRS